MLKQVLWVVKLSLLVYIGFGAMLYVMQRSFIYLPTGENPSTDVPSERLAVDGTELKLWRVGDHADHAVIYFGGNAEDVYYNADDFSEHMPDTTAYLVNYRGYGGSTGTPSEAALFADAEAVFDVLASRHKRVSVIGRSLGSGIATYLASVRPVHRVVLVTPHDSVQAIAEKQYPFYPVGLMLKDKYESVRYAQDIEAHVLLVIAERDTLIPPEHSYRLAKAFDANLVSHIELTGAGHNDLSRHTGYWSSIALFLNDNG